MNQVSFHFNGLRKSLYAVTLIAGAALVTACGTKEYQYQPYDPALDERLRALEAALAEQDSQQQAAAAREQRLDRIEQQLAQISSALSAALNEAKVSEEEPMIEREPAAVQLPEPTPAPPPLSADQMVLTTPSADFEFDGWGFFESRLGKRLNKEFNAEADLEEFAGNRYDLIGEPLSRRRFLGPTGEIVNLDDYKDSKNVLLVFHRGFAGNVCISCSVYTIALADKAQDFLEADTQVFLVYPGDARSVPAFLEAVKNVDSSFELPYPVLLDVDLGAVRELMIEGALAKPTALIISKEGVVDYAYTGDNLEDRPSVPSLLEEARRINGSAI